MAAGDHHNPEFELEADALSSRVSDTQNSELQYPQINNEDENRMERKDNEVSGGDCLEKKKYFYYDAPHYEDTGVWIPVSVPPMLETEHEEWSKGFYANGGFFPENDMGWGQLIGDEKEMTMWDVMAEMVLAARGKVSSLASPDIYGCRVS